jgi:hypothetical protein
MNQLPERPAFTSSVLRGLMVISSAPPTVLGMLILSSRVDAGLLIECPDTK